MAKKNDAIVSTLPSNMVQSLDQQMYAGLSPFNDSNYLDDLYRLILRREENLAAHPFTVDVLV